MSDPCGTCTGQCCARFYLPYSLEMLKRRAQQGKAANGTVQEMRTIAEMVIPLEGGRCVGLSDGSGRKKGTRLFAYTCRYWDKVTKLCGIYARRPVVCREHPTPNQRIDGKPGCNLDKDNCTLTAGTDPAQAVEDFKLRRA